MGLQVFGRTSGHHKPAQAAGRLASAARWRTVALVALLLGAVLLLVAAGLVGLRSVPWRDARALWPLASGGALVAAAAVAYVASRF